MTRCLLRCLFFAAASISICGFLFADDDVDHFILPETPPTIDRLKKPPLDKPTLKRQNFLPQTDIILPPVLLGYNFFPFFLPEYARTIGMAAGSFSSRMGQFSYASPGNVTVQYRMFRSDGESPGLYQEQRLFSTAGEQFLQSPVRIKWDAHSDESVVFDQNQKQYALTAGVIGYPQKNIRLDADASYETGQLGLHDKNENIRGGMSLLWQPKERHSVDVSVTGESDTAFSDTRDFTSAEFIYTIEPLTALTVGSGCRYLKDAVFPYGNITWFAFHRVRVSVVYRPGFEKLSWTETYLKNRWYAAANPLLAYPENTFCLTEEMAYHQGERTVMTARFTQKKQKNYLFWEQPVGALVLTPGNGPETALHEVCCDFSHQGDIFFGRASVTARSDSNAPLVPEYRSTAELGCTVASWTISVGYDYIDSRLVRQGSLERLDAQGSVTAGIKKRLGSAEAAITVDNITGQRLTLQPGFVREQPSVIGSLTVQF